MWCSVELSTFTLVCDHHHRPCPECWHLSKQKLCTPQTTAACFSLPQPLVTPFYFLSLWIWYCRYLTQVESYICPLVQFSCFEYIHRVVQPHGRQFYTSGRNLSTYQQFLPNCHPAPATAPAIGNHCCALSLVSRCACRLHVLESYDVRPYVYGLSYFAHCSQGSSMF